MTNIDAVAKIWMGNQGIRYEINERSAVYDFVNNVRDDLRPLDSVKKHPYELRKEFEKEVRREYGDDSPLIEMQLSDKKYIYWLENRG